MAPRIRSLSVRGFRAYGIAEQTLKIPSDIAVVWGPNSKGKTSLAEAFEFLLTGRIARRELLGSTQDEFADALRNAHLGNGEEVYVSALIKAVDDSDHEIKRILTADYSKKQNCKSRLEIDGVVATEDELAKLGILLSQPPLEAPVLAQHTLSYIFSIRPQDRANYLKTLLEVTDLEDFRNQVAELAANFESPVDSVLTKFNNCLAVPILNATLHELQNKISDTKSFNDKLQDTARILLDSTKEKIPETFEEKLEAIERALADRRNKTFPIVGFERGELAVWNIPKEEVWNRLNNYIGEYKKIDEETRQLAALFQEALKLHCISKIHQPVHCPLCGTESALTPERVQLIRKQVADTRGFRTAEESADAALKQLSALAEGMVISLETAIPKYLRISPIDRRKFGFTVSRIRELLGKDAGDLVAPWVESIKGLIRGKNVLLRQAKNALFMVTENVAEFGAGLDVEKLRTAFGEIDVHHKKFKEAITKYKEPAERLTSSLNSILDAHSDTAGWQDFLDIAKQTKKLRNALIVHQARKTVGMELNSALKQIDRGKENVLDEKFSEYSGTIQDWWERLRPDEPTFFSAVQPRKGAKRTIDFKAGLSPHPDRSAPKVRDVIAVFSQSQLHCLGLSLFLARAQLEGLGFMILDDPVLSSDEDYRVHFNSTVVAELLKVPMQIIILTQDHNTWEELETRYRHLGIAVAQLYIESPAEGSIIENTSDMLLSKISRAKSLARGGHPDIRKECGLHLRDAGERFCKELLVKDRRKKGDITASLNDYDDKTLEWLCPRIEPFLDVDASHSGKLNVFKMTVNRACHDDVPPGNAEMIVAHGDIRHFVKVYLER